MEKKKISGKEVRYLLKQNSINLSWLSEQLGISAQAMQERLKAQEFKSGYLLESCFNEESTASTSAFTQIEKSKRRI